MEYKSIKEFRESAGYEIDSKWYPRVTSIVSIKAKPALYKYYANLGNYDEGERIKQKSAEEGTAVHEAIQAVMIGKELPENPEMKAVVDAFLKFNETAKIQADPEWIEKRIINNDDRYSGTVDSVVLLNGKLGVLDIKTSQAIYRDYCLQTSAYMATIQKSLKELSTRWILRIDQKQVCPKCRSSRRTKGGREVIKIPYGNSYARNCRHEWSEMQGEIELQEFPSFHEDYQAFLGAKTLWEWEHLDLLKKVGYR